jgi:hypothetical protein
MSVIVCHIANGVCASIVRDRTISGEMRRLFAVWAMVAPFIVLPSVILHLTFHLKCSVEKDGSP